jgi:SAM-dependent methyltransferase
VERPPGSFDLVLLFAVLTRVPADEDQRALIAEVRRLPAPGGLLYVSDLLRGSDPRRQGVFTTSDGAVCRHHDAGYLRGLLDGFEIAAEKRIEVATMNGNRAAGMRLLAVRS